jgi:hypothetical protein
MEAGFGYDFSHVRVHSGELAQRSAAATNAEAYTVGQDIVFASGRYAPMSSPGRRLLAHELTHVVQQNSSTPVSARAIEIGKADEHEASAEQAAIAVAERGEPVAVNDSIGLGLQRDEATGRISDRPFGEPLDTSTRGLMEGRFGRDFSSVRIHRDSRARDLTGAMNAFAVTNEANIYFASDGYAPATPFGRAILGHELAHVAQNQSTGSGASVSSLESEAARAATAVTGGRYAAVHHSSNQPVLAMTRAEKTAAGAGIGAASVGALGAGIGLIAASQMGGQPFGKAAAIGGAIGAGVGAIIGGLIGFFSRRTSSESTAEAEALIQRRYGRYLRGGATGPLHNASVHVVSAAELCERRRCRTPNASCDFIGWTDTGVPVRPSAGPGNQPPPIQSQADEPICNGVQMEHATPEHPVIYYQRNSETAGTLIHEGIHAHSHPSIEFLHNHVVEGTTEYFTRRLQDDVNMPYISGYDRQVASVEKLIGLVGEERLAQAYFGGAVPELHQAVNSQLGRCALITWAYMLEVGSDQRAEMVLAGRNQNYCNSPWLLQLGVSPAAMTPGEGTQPQQQPGATQPPPAETP